jgi:stage II sporulation protein D
MMADDLAAHSSPVVAARAISVPDEAAAWERLGFALSGGATQVGGVRIAFGAAEMAVAATGMSAERPDGLALVHARAPEPGPSPAHANGAIVLDHVVALTDDLRRTVDALEAAGLDLRRDQPPMAFLRLGELILEVVERPGADAETATGAPRLSSIRMRIALATVVAALALAAPASADYVIDGRGWGHGVGMSQYGAYGYALNEGRDFRWILGHYYTGTTVGRVSTSKMRVKLRRTRVPKVCGATRLRDSRRRSIRLRDTRVYRLSPRGATGLRVVDASNGHTRARVQAPVRVLGGTSVCLRGTAENGVRNGSYRGTLRIYRDRGASIVVNDVGLESYLFGVVASEMPSNWATEALKAQAVVARSYALRSRRPLEEYDVFADTRSQMYRGIAGEAATATAAARATRGLAVRYGVEIAQTFFHSTSGGRTAANEEGFGGVPVPYLRSVDDPYDSMSPVHEWTVTLTDRQAAKLLNSVREGDLEDLKVTSTTPTGRVSTLDVEAEDGTTEISGGDARSMLELRSTWFGVRHVEARPTRR